MILSNVNIGTGPSSGDGDPLRNAFTTINNNFQTIKNNVNALTNSVTTVAGRTGNVVLTVNDVIGAASVAYVNSQFANAGSYSNVNVTAFLPSYSGNIAAVITANLAMKGYVDASIAGLVDSAPGTLDTLNELAAALGNDPNLSVTLTNTINSANTIMKAYVDGQITAANTLAYSNVNTLSYLTTNSYATQNYVNLANTSLKNYVDGQIAAANTSSNYGNAQVATYLASYGGNVAVGNIIFDDLSVQTTAYTGTQWRSNLQSNVRVKPSWLSYVPGGKNQEGTQYGFDAGGMFFTSNADNDFAYPIQTNLHFHEEDVLEVVATICYGATNNDHGLCIFPADTRPIWRAGTDASRIAFQFNAGIPLLYGRTTANTAPGNSILTDGNYYTIKFVYDKDNTVTVSTFSGNTATGTALDIRSVNEVMPAGDYKLGFDADNDSAGVKSYWTNLVVRTLTNTVVNNLEVQGRITGNLIPSANVIYDLGNVTHRWRDLWLSGSTIHIGNANISVSNGSIQSSAPIRADITGNVTAGNITVSGNTISIGGATLDVSTGTLESSLPIATTNLTINGPRLDFVQGAFVEESEIAGNPGHYGLALNSPDDGIVGLNALDSNADVTSSVIVSNVLVQLNVANSTPGGNALVWLFDQSGNITFPDGTSQNTAGGGSYANIAVKTYLENYDGSIVQIPDEHLYIRVQDADDDSFSVYQQVDDGASTVLGQTRLRRDQYVIDFPVEGFQFRFTDIGQAELPGNIRFNEYVDSSIYAVSDNSYNGSAELKVISYSGDTLGSNVRVTQNYASISTNNAQYSWLFTNTNRLIVPQHSVITTANATGGLGGNTISIVGGASDADTWNSNPGGNVDIQGGYGSFADGSGGPGGDVNIRGGGSSDAQAGRVIISSGANDWLFDWDGTTTIPGGITSDSTITITNQNTSNVADVIIQSGDDIILQAKDRLPGNNSEGGDINIFAGDGCDDNGVDGTSSAGDVTIEGGIGGAANVSNGGGGGFVAIRGGQGGSASATANAGSGSTVTIAAGDAGTNNGFANRGSIGGDISISAGDSNSVDDDGGTITLTSGTNTDGANRIAGYVEINIPSSNIGLGGTWTFDGTGRTFNVPQDSEIFGANAGNLTVASAGNVFIRSIDYTTLTPYTWQFSDVGILTLPGEGVIQSLDDTINLTSLNTTSGFANTVYLGSGGGLGFTDQAIGGNWLEIFRSGITPEIKAPTGNLLITSVVPGVSSNTWTFGQNGSITFPDNTVQTTAWTGTVAYGNTIALGYSAGVDQGEYSVAIGSEAGATTQGNLAVAVGRKAGSSIQGDGAVAVGESAGWAQQGEGAVAVGREAALADQSAYAVAIGYNAGADTQGAYSIAIGQGAGTASQPANSIIINSSADSLNTSTAGLYINPIRNTTGNVGVLQYNNATKEVSYSTNVTLGNVTLGNIIFADSTVQNTAYTGFTANSANWSNPAPTTLNDAIDRLAILVKALNSGTGA